MSVAEMMRAALVEHGATVTLTHDPSTYDAGTDTRTDLPPVTQTAPAIETRGDPDRFAALGLTLRNPVTLLVSADGLETPPAPGDVMEWAGLRYAVQDVQPTSLDGAPMAWRITGST